MLSVLDRKWREHLYEMDYLKEGIGLRAMAQRDPLVEYQREGFDMFARHAGLAQGGVRRVPVQPAGAGGAGRGAGRRRRRRGWQRAGGHRRLGGGDRAGSGGSNGGAPPTDAQRQLRRRRRQPVRRRVRPVEALPTEQAAGSGRGRDRDRGPAALRGKGLGGPPAAAPLTYSGPTRGRRHRDPADRWCRGGPVGRGDGDRSKEPARNAPCPCGSGKKYKLCHGRPGARLKQARNHPPRRRRAAGECWSYDRRQ